MKAKNNIKTLAQLIDEQFGKKGTPKREVFEKKLKKIARIIPRTYCAPSGLRL